MIDTQETINTNDLIADLADLNERMADIYNSAMSAEDNQNG